MRLTVQHGEGRGPGGAGAGGASRKPGTLQVWAASRMEAEAWLQPPGLKGKPETRPGRENTNSGWLTRNKNKALGESPSTSVTVTHTSPGSHIEIKTNTADSSHSPLFLPDLKRKTGADDTGQAHWAGASRKEGGRTRATGRQGPGLQPGLLRTKRSVWSRCKFMKKIPLL
ncbi:hypothetical protein HJG60_010349 [Phyllostomus discolor]|uniref:Uncharacterized protein n=1 Tax=Phyllostomus discolor TaxID=89673 RepID=A0A834AT05_9CHIR|nr:hypothetical protein HJG60_010349 [Phyllostomus discolor]